MEHRLLKVKCSCGGSIGYFPSTDTFKCTSCDKPVSSGDTALRRAMRVYWQSDKGRETQKRYRHSDKGKVARSFHVKSVKGKLTRKKYYYGEKGQAAHLRRRTKVKQFKALDRFLKDNPDKTPEDFFKQQPPE